MEQYSRDGWTFEVTDHGAGDQGVIVLLHGFPEDRSAWDRVAPVLADAGYRVLVPELRGYGPGPGPRGRRDYTAVQVGDDIIALLGQAGLDRVHLVGHDWGAVVSWSVAGRYPERFTSLTTLSVPHPGAFTKAMSRPAQLLKSWYIFYFQLPWLPERTLSWHDGAMLKRMMRGSGLSEDLVQRYALRTRSPDGMSGPLGGYRALPYSSGDPVLRVGVPTLFIWGDEDQYVSRAAAEGCAEWVTGPFRFVEVAGGSHWLPEMRPAEVAALVLGHVAGVTRAGGAPA
ncbi:MAG: alpha/beta fold hydrolase [Trebonia sp.]